jgi:hypothetical protein
MKNIERIIFISIILCLLFFLFKNKKLEQIVINGSTKIDTIYFSRDSLIVKNSVLYNHDTLWMHDTLWLPTDTVAILADYFKMISYDSVMLKNDSSITAWVDIKLTQNRLYGISGYFINNKETVIYNNNYNGLYTGVIAGKGIMAPVISYKYNKHMFGVGYNLDNNGILIEYKYKF